MKSARTRIRPVKTAQEHGPWSTIQARLELTGCAAIAYPRAIEPQLVDHPATIALDSEGVCGEGRARARWGLNGDPHRRSVGGGNCLANQRLWFGPVVSGVEDEEARAVYLP